MTVLEPPVPEFPSRRAYVESLHHREVWQPYVSAVLALHRLPWADLEVGQVGKYPTFLVGDVVVKLFGRFPSWRGDHAVERFLQQRLHDVPEVLAPRLLGSGELYGDHDQPWPYLITERVHGIAWRDARGLTSAVREAIAHRLGERIRTLHGLAVPAGPPFESDWLTQHGRDCATRLAANATLPAHLLEQVGDYLAPIGARRSLTHGDLTEDHLFVDDRTLKGIIDWGDAQVTDPCYELPPLYLGAFGGDRELLRAFLAGYGWNVDGDFPRRALSITLMHRKAEFLVRRIRAVVDLDSCRTLADVADAVWRL
ncbi:phosphotransferase family protein [Microlunatus sp. GCM10028923]|uniref:phosphotransferase family protein n=1 Tax=Microlunatus sp. GCM10028923 TaxID=3273400 RepID=UPI003623F530